MQERRLHAEISAGVYHKLFLCVCWLVTYVWLAKAVARILRLLSKFSCRHVQDAVHLIALSLKRSIHQQT